MADSSTKRKFASFKEAMASPNEFCVRCMGDMGFSKQLFVDHPQRHRGGAVYVEGNGQWCGECMAEAFPPAPHKDT